MVRRHKQPNDIGEISAPTQKVVSNVGHASDLYDASGGLQRLQQELVLEALRDNLNFVLSTDM